MPRILLLLLAVCTLAPAAQAQRMKSEKERFTYTQYPSDPLPGDISTFRVNLKQTARETFGIEFRGWQSEVKAEWAAFKELNAEMAPKCPVITEKKDALGD